MGPSGGGGEMGAGVLPIAGAAELKIVDVKA